MHAYVKNQHVKKIAIQPKNSAIYENDQYAPIEEKPNTSAR
jgi:hypothetical protein